MKISWRCSVWLGVEAVRVSVLWTFWRSLLWILLEVQGIYFFLSDYLCSRKLAPPLFAKFVGRHLAAFPLPSVLSIYHHHHHHHQNHYHSRSTCLMIIIIKWRWGANPINLRFQLHQGGYPRMGRATEVPGSCDPPRSMLYRIGGGGRPLNIISFRWSHIAHNVAKMVCHSVSRRKGPWQIDCQNASLAVTSIPPRAAAFQMVWTNGDSKNRWEQSSVALERITHRSSAFRIKALLQGARHQAVPYEKPTEHLDL